MNSDTFRRLGEAAPPLLAVFDEARVFQWANASWTRELGWTPDELTHRTMDSLVHPDDAVAHANAIRGASSVEPGTTLRTRFAHKDGGWRWIDWFVAGLAEGLFYARDVTAVMRGEQAMNRQVQLMVLAEEISGVGHWSLNVLDQELWWSSQTYRIHGHLPGDFQPTLESAINSYHPEDRGRVAELVGAAIAQGGEFEFELRLIRSDQEARTVVSRGRCDVDPVTGVTTAVFGTFLDVTDRDHLRDRLAREQRLVTTGMLAAGVGHEMNNPLTYVSMNLDVVIEELQAMAGVSPSGRLRSILQALGEAQAGAVRLKKIIRGLRAFAREDSPPAPTELLSVVDLSINMAMHEIRPRATCVSEFADLPLVDADDSRLSQVLVNLICNAAQSFEEMDPSRNLITVRGALSGPDHVVVSVSDNGPGIPPAVRDQIFQPFFTTKPVGEGTGLGLAISQTIVESFGGELTCETMLGVGTTFSIRLHKSVNASAGDDDSPAPMPAPRRGHLVLIDDEDAVLRTMSKVLSLECQVTAFTDPRLALDCLLAETNVDAVLCDLSMPFLSGKDVYERVLAVKPELAERFVFMSGGAPREELRVFLASVDHERLDKPFELSQLRALVRRVIARQ